MVPAGNKHKWKWPKHTDNIFYHQSKNILKNISPPETSSRASGHISVSRYVEEAVLTDLV